MTFVTRAYQVDEVYTPRALRFDPDAGDAGLFYDAPPHHAAPSVAPPADIGNERAASNTSLNDATSVHSGQRSVLGAAACCAAPGTQHPNSSFGSPVSTAVQHGLLEGAGESLWQLVQDVERMSICV